MFIFLFNMNTSSSPCILPLSEGHLLPPVIPGVAVGLGAVRAVVDRVGEGLLPEEKGEPASEAAVADSPLHEQRVVRGVLGVGVAHLRLVIRVVQLGA